MVKKHMFRVVFVFAFTACFHSSYSQKQGRIDSLLNAIKSATVDTNYANNVNELCWEFRKRNDFKQAHEYGLKGIEVSYRLNFSRAKAKAHNNIGLVHFNIGDYGKALENLYQSLKFYEAEGNKKGTAIAYNNIGMVYSRQGNFEQARKSFFTSLALRDTTDRQGMVTIYNNIGNAFADDRKYKEALDYYSLALKLNQKTKDQKALSTAYINIGVVHAKQGQFEKALSNYLRAYEIRKNSSDKQGLASTHNKLGNIYILLKKPDVARKHLTSCLEITKSLRSKPQILHAYLSLAQCDSAQGKWENAFLNYALFKRYSDSVFTEENAEKAAHLSIRYDSDKKEAQIKILEKDREKQAAITMAENERHRVVVFSVSLGLFLLLLFSAVMFKRWKITQHQKKIIEEQKKLVDLQKFTVEEKNKSITDSITYAKRIQQAKLPKKESITDTFKNAFILFKPKDIVSGDFFFSFEKIKDGKKITFIAAADCTGHGVPGAFMSIICSEKLTEALEEVSDPAEALVLVNKKVRETLHQTSGDDSTRDGMDIALIAYDETNNSLSFSGANRPLWIIPNGEKQVIEIKPTKKAIGGHTPDDQQFERVSYNLQKGDSVYLFSDGYADTFGGPQNKKLTTKKFRELIQNAQKLAMKDQEIYLSDFFEKWRGTTEPVDDILVIGIEF